MFWVSALFVLSGGLFILVGPAQGIISRNGPVFVYPGDINNQTPQESVFVLTIYSLGLLGLCALFSSTGLAYRPGRAYGLLAMSLVMTMVFLGTAYFVLFSKISPN